MTTAVQLSTMTQAVRAATDRFCDLIGGLPDPAAPLPGSTWTVREAVAHVVTVAPRYAQGARHEGEWVADPRDLAALNDRQIRQLGPLDLLDLPTMADQLRTGVDALIAQLDRYGRRPPEFRFHGGELVTADASLGILLGELLVHGWDLARVTRSSWPITGPDVELVMCGLEPILPGWIDPAAAHGHTATYAIHVRGGRTHIWSFNGGRLTVGTTARHRPHVHIGGRPDTLLPLLYQRLPPWRAALTGRVVAWGPRPLLAFGLPKKFHRP
jgi:uncharacterized protein (TIGR03083 family)